MNLMQVPRQQNRELAQVYFNESDFKRVIPRGIIPYPNHKRVVLEQPLLQNESLMSALSHSDDFTRFNRSPYEFMVSQELQKAKQMQGISPEVSMICNLQNVKQGLKSDYSDEKIAKFLFSDLRFTDDLIQEHLDNLFSKEKTQAEPNFVPRDPTAFRKFMTRPDPLVVSPYDHFYMREALKKGDPQAIYEEIKKLEADKSQDHKEIIEKKFKQIEDLIMNYKMLNNDAMNLTKALDNDIEVEIDLASLDAMNPGTHQHRTMTERDLSDSAFLSRERCRAETNLIKARIVHKLYSLEPLSDNEKRYLEIWHSLSQDLRCVLGSADPMLPSRPTSLKISNLLPEDLYALNSVPKVDLHPTVHGDFSLNDLIVELTHLIDSETVRKVELSMLEQKLKTEWDLADNFQLVNQRNKESDLALKEMEEMAWRVSSSFSQAEFDSVKEMLDVDRNWRAFDKEFYQVDV